MRIKRSADCGNSPKNKFAEDVVVALWKGKAAELARLVAEDCRCDVAGDATVVAPRALVGQAFGTQQFDDVSLRTVITHGRVGAVEGVVDISGTAWPFCIVMRFTSAKAERVGELRLYAPMRHK